MISVIVTLYNYARYVEYAIKTFLLQDIKGVETEMVIVDDASTDEPLKTIGKLVGDKVRYIRLDKNGGYSHAKNIGIRESKGDVLVMLDADDLLTTNSLSLRYRKLQEGYDLVHGPAKDLTPDRNDWSVLPTSPLWKKWMSSPKDASCFRFIHAQTVMLQKEVHRKVGLYDETLRFKSDREMWARVLNHGFKVGWVTEPVAIYRIHEKQMHKSKEKAAINKTLQKEVDEKILRRSTDLSDVQMLE